MTIVEDVCEATPELFREKLFERIEADLAKIAGMKGMKDLIVPVECEQIGEHLFEYYLRDVDGKEVVVTLELRPVVAQ